MTFVSALQVKHIRAHTAYSLKLTPHINVITGPNGSGKTSLLEALYIAMQGSSFKGSDTDILTHDAPWYRIDVTLQNTIRTVKFDPERLAGRKQFVIDSKTQYRLSHQHKYPVVLFEPDDLRLLSGSPTRRRAFIDRFITQLDPRYGLSLRRYERALKQRNALLKQQTPNDSLFAWDVSLSEYGAYIIDKRLQIVTALNERLNETYQHISHSNDTLRIRYSEEPHANIKQKLLSELHQHAAKDSLLGFTSKGPHRHDIIVEFNHLPAPTVASRGEIRSIVLGLKFLEADMIESVIDKRPIILLDDVFSELDQSRQRHLLDSMKEHQIIITSATTYPNINKKSVVRL